MKKIYVIICLMLSGVFSFAQAGKQGERWFDTNGNLINAHGGGILFYRGTYYWFGEFKRSGKTGNLSLDGVSCYSSKDLNKWKNRGIALQMVADTNSLLQPGCTLERPKVIYNAKTRKFVMWFHHELKDKGYSAALTGLAVADRPAGPYTYIKSIRLQPNVWPVNLPESERNASDTAVLVRQDKNWKSKVAAGALVRRDFKGGQMSRDMTLYVDDDGTAYHIASSEDNQTLHISKLSDDYASFTDEYYRVLPGGANEAPAIFKLEGKYYLFTSGTTGWSPNPARAFISDNIYGPWEVLGNPVKGTEQDKATTFRSQSTYILPVKGKKNLFVFMADRWNPDDLRDSRYLWLPIIFENQKPFIEWKENWLPK